MLPSFIYSSYKAYNEDTKVVATWLVNTAKRWGFSDECLAHETKPSQPSTRLKGKARKEAKEAAKATNSHEPPDEDSSINARPVIFQVKAGEYITLAKHLSVLPKRTIEVPDYVAAALERAIKLRAEHYSSNVRL